MTNAAVDFLGRTVQATVNELAASVIAAVPRLIAGLIFLAIAYAGIRAILGVVRGVLARVYDDRDELIAQLFVSIVGVFLWFGAALGLLKVIGMGEVAASLGTAAGFIALGVSYALSNMIEDTVSGVYLLRDADFNPGDEVAAESITGTVQSIELRKSRIELENGDVTVLANRDVEKRWTKMTDDHGGRGGESGESDESGEMGEPASG
jgi:small-conductance mechanosensitive channel